VPADWTPLDEGDPLPGNPGGVNQLAGLLAADATELRTVIDRLNAVDTCEIWSGENADRFSTAKSKVVPDLVLVAKRMEDASRTLTRFVPGMDNSQALARTALHRARDASDALASANTALDEEERQRRAAEVLASGGADQPTEFRNPSPPVQATWGPSWTGVRDQATEELDAARRLFSQARQDYRDAANLCAHDLGEAIDDHLKDHHSRGLLGGLGHMVGTGVHAVATGVHAMEDGVAWVNDHLPNLDQMSELLGVAAAIASLTGCEPLALALSGAKTALDVGLVLAGDGDWSKVRDDAIGLALFGAGRVLTGVARGRVVVGAGTNVAKLESEVAALKAQSQLAKDAAELKSISADLSATGSELKSVRAVGTKFAEDAPGQFWRRSLRMVTAEEAKLPAFKELRLSPSALVAAGGVKGIETYGMVKDSLEVAKKNEEWAKGRETLASEVGQQSGRKEG
jgi:hypothetical protein